jgi:hypothetical protein
MLAEYALSGIDKPIGVSNYELTRALPESLQSALPTVEQIEAELGEPGPESVVEQTAAASGRGRQVVIKLRMAAAKKRPKV